MTRWPVHCQGRGRWSCGEANGERGDPREERGAQPGSCADLGSSRLLSRGRTSRRVPALWKGGGSDDITAIRRYGDGILITLVNMFFGARYMGLCYRYNCFWARHLPVLDRDCAGFEVESVMNIRVAKAGLLVQEVPSHEHARMHSESNHVIRDGWRIAKVVARARLLRHGRARVPRVRTPVSEIAAAALVAGHSVRTPRSDLRGCQRD